MNYEKQLNIRRTIVILSIISFAVIIPLVFYIYTVNETNSLKYLDEERYSSRMTDSLRYALVMLGCLLLLMSPFVFIVHKFFERYLKFITTLTSNDLTKLIALNEKEIFIYKYLPSYIIRGKTVTFFTLFYENTINFDDIVRIEVRESFYKGYHASITITTLNNKYSYTLSGNSFKVRSLIQEALTANPNITNNQNWQ